MTSFRRQYENYKKLHRNTLNRFIHAISLFIIPYCLYLLFKQKYLQSLIYYIIFIHIIPWFIGHVCLEHNYVDVFKHFKKFDFNKFAFFTIYTPILRIIDAYHLIIDIPQH